MSKPRIFLSSTFYDLKYIRNDLEIFILQLGYEPVLHERGHIPYGNQEALEQYCYKEISNCDIVINIVGSRFGSQSHQEAYSVSQLELRTSHEQKKQIYIFIEKAVHHEYRTFLKNEKLKDFSPQFVDDSRIYLFVKEVYSLGTNNTVFEFESARDILDVLREQWAGLFQRYLQQESRLDEYRISQNLKETATVLAKIVQYTTQERDDTIKSVLIFAHPVFNQIATCLATKIRVFFETKQEMLALFNSFGYKQVECKDKGWLCFAGGDSKRNIWIYVVVKIFDAKGRLVAAEPNEWEETFAQSQSKDKPPDDDDVPF